MKVRDIAIDRAWRDRDPDGWHAAIIEAQHPRPDLSAPKAVLEAWLRRRGVAVPARASRDDLVALMEGT